MGLMLAVELDSAELAKQCGGDAEAKIVINCTSETVLRFLPPFILGSACGHAIAALDEILTEHAAASSSARPQEDNSHG